MPRLKVMTLNLGGYRGHWPTRRDRLIEVMQAEEIDVLLLQEVAERPWRPNQALELAMQTGYMVAYATAQRYFPWPPFASGLAILSRFPLSNQIATEITPAPGFFALAANGGSASGWKLRWMGCRWCCTTRFFPTPHSSS